MIVVLLKPAERSVKEFTLQMRKKCTKYEGKLNLQNRPLILYIFMNRYTCSINKETFVENCSLPEFIYEQTFCSNTKDVYKILWYKFEKSCHSCKGVFKYYIITKRGGGVKTKYYNWLQFIEGVRGGEV